MSFEHSEMSGNFDKTLSYFRQGLDSFLLNQLFEVRKHREIRYSDYLFL